MAEFVIPSHERLPVVRTDTIGVGRPNKTSLETMRDGQKKAMQSEETRQPEIMRHGDTFLAQRSL